jgi:hypothetical protein
MKKLYIVLLALAIAAFAVPAMAGDVAMDGEYTFGGESYSEADYGTFYDELDLNIEVSMGDVLFHWDFEVVDDPNFDRGADEGASDNYTKTVDTMWVKWQATDALALKIGDYGLGWGSDIVMDAAMDGTGTVGLMYGLDMVDLAFYLSRDEEGNRTGNGEDDITTMGVTAEGEIGPAAVGLVYLQTTDDINDDSGYSLVGAYADFAVGPVGIWLEVGAESADDNVGGDGGQVILAEFGLDELVGFGLTLTYVQTNEDWYNNYANDFDRVKLFDIEGEGDDLDWMAVFAGIEYGYSDELTLGLNAMLMNDVDGDSAGEEFDVWATYAFADNVSAEFGYGSLTEGDIGAEESIMWHEWVFAF